MDILQIKNDKGQWTGIPAIKGATYTAGDGISIQDNTISVDTTVRGIVTQAEFDALPAEQQKKGLYVIDDGRSGGGASMEVYDDQERVIGTWFGKPLYRKTWETVLADSGNASMVIQNVENMNLDVVTHMFGVVQASTTSFMVEPIPFTIDKTAYTRLYISEENALTIFTNREKFFGRDAVIVMEYTKTTD